MSQGSIVWQFPGQELWDTVEAMCLFYQKNFLLDLNLQHVYSGKQYLLYCTYKLNQNSILVTLRAKASLLVCVESWSFQAAFLHIFISRPKHVAVTLKLCHFCCWPQIKQHCSLIGTKNDILISLISVSRLTPISHFITAVGSRRSLNNTPCLAR